MSQTNNQILLDVKNMRKYFPIRRGILQKVIGHVRAVDDVTFYVNQGETLSLVGESGCGKTTTARCILRGIDPTAGQVFFRTEEDTVLNVAALSQNQMQPLRRQMQMIFQDPFSSLNPRMTLLDIVGEPLLVHGEKSAQVRTERVAELLRLVGLRPEYMRRYPHAFIGGQRQRIGIARALALNPRLVVADEPVSALDVSVQAAVLNLLLDIQREMGTTLVFIAHDLSVVRFFCDTIAVMYLGQVAEVGPAEAIYAPPYHPYTEALLSSVPIPDPRVEQSHIRLSGTVPSALNPPSGCRFHTRCPRKLGAVCEMETPPWQTAGTGQRIFCHIPIGDLSKLPSAITLAGV